MKALVSVIRATVLIFAMDGSGAGATANAAAHSRASITIEAEQAGTRSKDSPIVLYDAQILDPFRGTALLLATPRTDANVTWSASSSAVTTSYDEPHYASAPGVTIPTAPPNGIYISGGTSYGSAVVSASADAGNDSAGVTVLHFASLAFGCRLRYYPAWNFSANGGAAVGTSEALGADLYATIPSDPGYAGATLDRCSHTTLAVAGSAGETWHAPGGGILVPTQTLREFVALEAARWRNDATSFPASSGPATLVFKTKTGLIVKAMLPVGPYEISDRSGRFTY